jgi:hypothetical protein
MRAFLTSVITFVTLSFVPMGPVFADPVTCVTDSDGWSANSGCAHSGAQTLAYIVAHSGHAFRVAKACTTENATCHKTPSCPGGLVYDVWEDEVLLSWQTCLTLNQENQINGLTPGFVEHAFKRLHWPSSELVIQPPHGKTLVNFETNFYTTNTSPRTQTVTLLGQRITVEATPTHYTWHFGTGETDLTTTDPGAAYPHLQVTHRYLHIGTDHPSVDTTYTGRYRVNNGSWQTIPDTLTVPGQSVDLQVVSATPHLVDN